jgi:prepilin signal peptidase PulO-like enzyme (type II secretory pathway)
MNLLILFFAFLLGASLGSFFAATFIRLKKGESLHGRSLCFACKKKLRVGDNVPIFSWLLLRGKSACCQQSIPAFYFYFETSFAFLFVILAALFIYLI